MPEGEAGPPCCCCWGKGKQAWAEMIDGQTRAIGRHQTGLGRLGCQGREDWGELEVAISQLKLQKGGSGWSAVDGGWRMEDGPDSLRSVIYIAVTIAVTICCKLSPYGKQAPSERPHPCLVAFSMTPSSGSFF